MYFNSTTVAPLETNCYLLGDEKAGVCAVVDPGGSPERVLGMISTSGLTPVMILLTHGHFDHVRGVPGILAEYPELPVYIHEKELCEAEAWHKQFWLPHLGANQRTYGEGDVLSLGELEIRVLHVPGHSAGSVALLAEDVMIAGDTLFAGSCGRWDLPGGDGETLLQSLARLGKLKGDFKVCPGHGGTSSLERERSNNMYMRQAMAE